MDAVIKPASFPLCPPERQLNHKMSEGTPPSPQGWGQKGAGLLPGVPWPREQNPGCQQEPRPSSSLQERCPLACCHVLSRAVTACHGLPRDSPRSGICTQLSYTRGRGHRWPWGVVDQGGQRPCRSHLGTPRSGSLRVFVF